eukprot:365544-Chlamydomonas_euryale.AAC.3
MNLTTAISLSIPHGFQCLKLCWKAERQHYQAGTKSIESRSLGAFCMGHYAVAWAALSRIGCMVVHEYTSTRERSCARWARAHLRGHARRELAAPRRAAHASATTLGNSSPPTRGPATLDRGDVDRQHRLPRREARRTLRGAEVARATRAVCRSAAQLLRRRLPPDLHGSLKEAAAAGLHAACRRRFKRPLPVLATAEVFRGLAESDTPTPLAEALCQPSLLPCRSLLGRRLDLPPVSSSAVVAC